MWVPSRRAVKLLFDYIANIQVNYTYKQGEQRAVQVFVLMEEYLRAYGFVQTGTEIGFEVDNGWRFGCLSYRIEILIFL